MTLHYHGTPIYRRLVLAVLLSGLAGSVVDSALFLWLAFSSLEFLAGQVLGKFRGFHLPSTRFWEEEGFGYRKRGSAEGHW